MNTKIQLILKAKNITPAQLADDIGVQRSGISHILNGRNKPSLDFIQKLLKAYPDISMRWLMFGEGPMMNTVLSDGLQQKESNKLNLPQQSLIDLFYATDNGDEINSTPKEESDTKNELNDTENEEDESLSEILTKSVQKESTLNTINKLSATESSVKQKQPQNKTEITRIVIFYSDKTFTEYIPGE